MIFNLSGGGGGSLNFEVVGTKTAPANASPNTIWIDTDVEISSYVLSATQPTGEEGMVWIKTGTSSSVAFNALEENSLYIYPVSAVQYINGSWTNRAAYMYPDGTQWSYERVYIFNNGTVDGVTWTSSVATSGTVTTSGSVLKMDCTPPVGTTHEYSSLRQQVSYPVGNATELKIHFTRLSATKGNTGNYPLSISIDGGSKFIKEYTNVTMSNLTDGILTINVSGVSNIKLYFQTHLWGSLGSTCYLTIDRIWLE